MEQAGRQPRPGEKQMLRVSRSRGEDMLGMNKMKWMRAEWTRGGGGQGCGQRGQGVILDRGLRKRRDEVEVSQEAQRYQFHICVEGQQDNSFILITPARDHKK